MLSGLCIFSGLSEKKRAGLCFESLLTCLGDNNSPNDACLASARLILPPTHSAPRHPNHLYLFLCPAFPPLPYFPLSRSDWLPAWPIFLIYVCTYTWIPVGEEGENWRLKSLSSFLGDFPAPPLSWLVKVVRIMSYFILGYWYAAGRRRRSINWTHVCRPTVQGHSPAGPAERREKNLRITTNISHHVTPEPYS